MFASISVEMRKPLSANNQSASHRERVTKHQICWRQWCTGVQLQWGAVRRSGFCRKSSAQMQIKMDTDKSPRKRPKSKKLVRRKVKRERKPDTPMIKIHEPLHDKDSGSGEVFISFHFHSLIHVQYKHKPWVILISINTQYYYELKTENFVPRFTAGRSEQQQQVSTQEGIHNCHPLAETSLW